MTIDVKAYFGNQLIYRAATGLEKAMADIESARLLGTKDEQSELSAELITETWSPFKTQVRNLAHLAWARGVDLWEDGWTEGTQREWVSRQWEFKTKRGTIDGIRMALDFVGRDFVQGPNGYTLVQYVTPPQAFFVSPDLTVDEMNAWVHLMPELRIYLGHDFGLASGDEMYLTDEPPAEPAGSDGFLDVHAIGYDDGRELYGRRAILRQAGKPDQRLKVIEHEIIRGRNRAVDYETIFEPGLSEMGFHVDVDFLDDKYLEFDELLPKTYTVRYDRTYDTMRTELHLSAVVPSFDPLRVTYERDSDIGDAGPWLFLDDGALEVDYMDVDDAANMLADRVWLFDPNIAVPMVEGFSFLDVDRIGFPAYTMELMVDLHQIEGPNSLFVDEDFIEDAAFVDEDGSHIDRACRAIVAAKSLRDKALVAFDPLRQIEAGDRITEETTVSDWVPNEL